MIVLTQAMSRCHTYISQTDKSKIYMSSSFHVFSYPDNINDILNFLPTGDVTDFELPAHRQC